MVYYEEVLMQTLGSKLTERVLGEFSGVPERNLERLRYVPEENLNEIALLGLADPDGNFESILLGIERNIYGLHSDMDALGLDNLEKNVVYDLADKTNIPDTYFVSLLSKEKLSGDISRLSYDKLNDLLIKNMMGSDDNQIKGKGLYLYCKGTCPNDSIFLEMGSDLVNVPVDSYAGNNAGLYDVIYSSSGCGFPLKVGLRKEESLFVTDDDMEMMAGNVGIVVPIDVDTLQHACDGEYRSNPNRSSHSHEHDYSHAADNRWGND